MSHLRGEFTKITALHLLCIILTLMGQLLAKSQKQENHIIAMFVLSAEPSVLSNFSELAPPLHVMSITTTLTASVMLPASNI